MMFLIKNRKHLLYAFMFLPILAGCGAVDQEMTNDTDAVASAGEKPSSEAAELSSAQVSSLISSMERIFFDTNAHDLTNTNHLDHYVAALKAYKGNDLIFIIEGNCDKRGSREYNRVLGLRRAKNVFNYLVKSGVDSSMLDVLSNSYDKPVSKGNTLQDLAKNRNVQIVVRKRN